MASYLAEVTKVGGEGGNFFDFNGITNGATLQQIWVWAGDRQVRAIKVSLTDGNFKQFGQDDGKPVDFKFEDGEHFTSLSLWENGNGSRLGAIQFKTNHSRKFFVHMKKKDLKTEYPVDVGSGICLGITGQAGEKVDCLGFMFLKTIKSTVLTSVKYPTLHIAVPNVCSRELKSMTYHNNTSEPQEYKIETSKKITKKSSWSITTKLEFMFNLEVNAGIPWLAEGKAGYGLTLGVEGSYSSETTEENMTHFSFPVKVPPRKTVDADITIGEAKLDLPFNGVVKITCQNGAVLELNTSGTYKGVTHTGGTVAVNESDKKLGKAS